MIKVKNGEYAASLTLSKDDDVLITVKKKGYSFNSQYISSENNEFLSPTEKYPPIPYINEKLSASST